jgi:hypothetical protein
MELYPNARANILKTNSEDREGAADSATHPREKVFVQGMKEIWTSADGEMPYSRFGKGVT